MIGWYKLFKGIVLYPIDPRIHEIAGRAKPIVEIFNDELPEEDEFGDFGSFFKIEDKIILMVYLYLHKL